VVSREEVAAARPSLRLIGGFQICSDRQEIVLSAKKSRALITYLALNAGAPQSRESLAALFWGNTADRHARSNLRHTLHTIRRALGGDVASRLIVTRREAVEWPTDAADVDVNRLRALVAEGTPDSFLEAVALFRGELLDGFVVGEAAVDEWLDGQRRSLLRLRETVVQGLADFSPERVDPRVVIDAAEKYVLTDPLNEQVQRLLISAYLVDGRRADAARQYENCVELLRSELGVGPEPATKSLHESIVAGPTYCRPAQAREKPANQGHLLSEPAKLPPLSEWPSIAVLPFSVPGTDGDEVYLGQGLADEVIQLLYRYRWLRVIARGSSFNYRSSASDAQKAAGDLDVRYVIQGTVKKWNGRVRCMAQAMDATTGQCVWANHFDRTLDDIFLLVDELARSVVGELEPAIGQIERRRAMRATPDDLSAWSCYHRGLAHFYRFRRDDNPVAIHLLSRACSLEPDFAPAHAHLALARHWSVMHDFDKAYDRAVSEARESAERAVGLDPDSTLARYARSRIDLRERNHEGAIPDIRHAVTVSPSFAGGHFALGWYYNRVGRSADAHLAIEDAMRLSPQDPELCYFHMLRARAYLGDRRHEEARDWARRGLSAPNANPLPLLSTLVSALGHLGANEEAAQALKELQKVTRRPRTVGLYRDLMTPAMGRDFLEYFLEGLRRAGMPE